tara:strand:+ start:769 stop:1206 length:438 start_codon:yes stop_codon:yes gene_type:complete
MACILVTMTKLYQHLKTQSEKINETNDCAVKAIAVACGIQYKDAWNLARKFGRRFRGRTNSYRITFPAIKSKGFVCTDVWNHKMNKAKTIRSLKPLIPSRGVFLVFVRGHVFAVRGGEIHDWSEGRCHRITLIVRVSKKTVDIAE